MKTQSIVLMLLLVLGSGCSTVPIERSNLPDSFALPPRADGGFALVGKALQAQYGENKSGFLLVDSNEEGLRWRLALVDQAKHTLDLQYYLWYPEDGPRLLLKRILEAADRGVRVRMTLDDVMIIDMDEGLAVLDDHPNIEVRLFNPWEERANLVGRGIEAVQRMQRLNYRMHNKLLIADNQAVILGGRNIGNHYFGLSSDFNFHDLDVLGVGPVARQGSEIFDHFWNSEWVHAPHTKAEQPDRQESREAMAALLDKVRQSDRLDRFPLERQDWTETFASLPEQLMPGRSVVIYDKVDETESVSQEMGNSIGELFKAADREILVINAYLIPNERSIERLKAITGRGVTIRVLTNSLESNDVAAVNSHYKEWRKPLIEAGVELYEMRADGEIQPLVVDTPPVQAEFMGLHSKAMVVDRDLVFIGSMNFDPRSMNINTEMGVVIDSPQLGEALAQLIERDMKPENSWHVRLDDDGDVIWESTGGIERSQPARDFGQRVEDRFFELFPKELY